MPPEAVRAPSPGCPASPDPLKSPPPSHRVPARGRAEQAGQARGRPPVSRVSLAGAPYHGRRIAALTPGTLCDDTAPLPTISGAVALTGASAEPVVPANAVAASSGLSAATNHP
jgi:hypothetical protein